MNKHVVTVVDTTVGLSKSIELTEKGKVQGMGQFFTIFLRKKSIKLINQQLNK